MVSSYLSLHILADGCVDKDITRAGQFLARCGCKYYNLTAASRYNESDKLIRLIKVQAPNAVPLWRGWPSDALNDGEIWKNVSPQEWVNFRIAPNISWIRELNVIPVTCNEVGVSGAEAQKWSLWEAGCIRRAWSQFQVRIAIMRFSTGNPAESEHENYNEGLKAAGECNSIISMNEYTSTNAEITDHWHVGRYKWAWRQQDMLGVKRSEIVIGEYGIAMVNPDNSLDPFHGYSSLGVNTTEHLNIIRHDGKTYQEDGVTACWFVFGKWPQGKGSFGVENNEDLLAKTEQAAQAGELALKAQAAKPTVPEPPNKGTGTRYTIDDGTLWKIRTIADISGAQVGITKDHESITVYKDTATIVNPLIWHYIERDTSPATESASGWIAWPLPVETVPPDEPPTLPPPFEMSPVSVRAAAVAHKALSNSYALLSVDSLRVYEQLIKLADVLEGKVTV